MKPIEFRASSLSDLREFPRAAYVLHCFQKKTPKTAKKDIDLAARRFKELLKELVP